MHVALQAEGRRPRRGLSRCSGLWKRGEEEEAQSKTQVGEGGKSTNPAEEEGKNEGCGRGGVAMDRATQTPKVRAQTFPNEANYLEEFHQQLERKAACS